MPPSDVAALDWITTVPGTVLDIGCCTGRHLKHLAERGLTATGIDTSAAAIRLAQQAGLNAHLADAHHYTPTAPVDTVIALGGGLGIAATRQGAPAFLAHLASWLTPTGALIVSSVDWSATASAHQHRTWTETALAEGRYPGDVRLRLRHGTLTGGWFDWTWIDPATLRDVAAEAGLTVSATRRFGTSWYAALLHHANTQRQAS